jgi:hypothetical protein
VPVVVVTSFPNAVPEALDSALESMKHHKYTVVLGSELAQPGQELTREESALVRVGRRGRCWINISAPMHSSLVLSDLCSNRVAVACYYPARWITTLVERLASSPATRCPHSQHSSS